MFYLALGCLALFAVIAAGRGRPVFRRREWRFLAGAAAIVCFAAGAYVGLRGGWGSAIVLAVVGLGLTVSARPTGSPRAKPGTFVLGDQEARSILGVGPDASEADIQAAYGRLMRLAHPDKGGTDGLAAQLNAARDRLLKR
jgi:hypothetical protein